MIRFAPLCALALAASTASAELSAAASAIDITPDPAKSTVWIAGFGMNRRATGVHDPIRSRALLVSDGKTRVAIVVLDLVGFMRPHVEKVRTRCGEAADYVLVASTHNHEGPDSMGIWGRTPFETGIDAAWMDATIEAIAAQVIALTAKLQVVTIRAAQIEGPVKEFVCDHRDPVVIDNALSALQLVCADGKTVASIANWACHPETLWSGNTLLTADYPGFLCARLEERLGGTALFVSGALGGMMTPDPLKDEKGEKLRTFVEAERIGRGIADRAVDALAKAEAARDPALSIRTRELLLPCTNPRFHVAMAMKLLSREIFDAEGKAFAGKISPKNIPWVKTEIGLLTLGPLQAALVPGELFPELAVGGFDGSKSFGADLVKKNNPNPPKIANAPKSPFLRELLNAPVEMIVGLANDELGYILPEYDFEVNDKSATLEPHPPGDHYEETNSLGKETAKRVMDGFAELLKE
ncbi:MAG: hypothetical protein FD180_3404 [Planctomycetota bacterium]|nr:MAG: hypothetical protein FD180_3404 [Planctomycetota bacterium]